MTYQKVILKLKFHHTRCVLFYNVDRLLDDSPESRRLFVWTDWVKYIECRKAVLSHVHFPTQDLLSKEMVVDPVLLNNLWMKTKLRDIKKEDRVIMKEYSSKQTLQYS